MTVSILSIASLPHSTFNPRYLLSKGTSLSLKKKEIKLFFSKALCFSTTVNGALSLFTLCCFRASDLPTNAMQLYWTWQITGNGIKHHLSKIKKTK